MGLLGDSRRSATVHAATATETIKLSAANFQYLLDRDTSLRHQITEYKHRLSENFAMQHVGRGISSPSWSVRVLARQPMCCSSMNRYACVATTAKGRAETHGGTSRLDREAGPPTRRSTCPPPAVTANIPLHEDCPPDTVHRAPDGEVFVADNCIGCGNCQRNCPYGVIQMASTGPVSLDC